LIYNALNAPDIYSHILESLKSQHARCLLHYKALVHSCSNPQTFSK